MTVRHMASIVLCAALLLLQPPALFARGSGSSAAPLSVDNNLTAAPVDSPIFSDLPKGGTALVLAGGGAKGAFEVGAVKYLYETLGIQPDVICGSSVGALNAAKLAEGPQALQELESLWDSIRDPTAVMVRNPAVQAALDDIFSLDTAKKLLLTLLYGQVHHPFPSVEQAAWSLLVDQLGDIESLYFTDPLRQLVASNFDPALMQSSGVELLITSVELEQGGLLLTNQHGHVFRPVHFTSSGGGYVGQIPLVDAVLASGAFPVMLPPIKWNGLTLVDGGLRENIPLAACRLFEPDHLYVIYPSPRLLAPMEQLDGYLGQLPLANLGRRLTEIGMNELMQGDFQGLAGTTTPTTVITPPFEIIDVFEFRPRGIYFSKWLGFEIARQVFEAPDYDYPFDECAAALLHWARDLDAFDANAGLGKDKMQTYLQSEQQALQAMGCPTLPGLTFTYHTDGDQS